MVALIVLALVALACLVGPLLTGHAPNRFYPDLRQLPAGLGAQPDAEHLGPALERLAFRMRAKVEKAEREGDVLHLTLIADAPIDRRSLVYLPRSDLFGPASVVAEGDGGRRLVLDLPVHRLRFLLGTDIHGRDLLTRSLVAGRISLAVGLTATLVALLIGVTYGRWLGSRAGQSMPR